MFRLLNDGISSSWYKLLSQLDINAQSLGYHPILLIDYLLEFILHPRLISIDYHLLSDQLLNVLVRQRLLVLMLLLLIANHSLVARWVLHDDLGSRGLGTRRLTSL